MYSFKISKIQRGSQLYIYIRIILNSNTQVITNTYFTFLKDMCSVIKYQAYPEPITKC